MYLLYLKFRFYREKIKKFNLDPQLSEQVDNIYTLKEILPFYRQVAGTHYKKQKDNKAD